MTKDSVCEVLSRQAGTEPVASVEWGSLVMLLINLSLTKMEQPFVPRADRPLAVDHVVFWHDSRVHVDAQGTLVIQGVAPEDTGNYSCQAANEVGTDEETVTLYYTGTRAMGISGGGPPSLPPALRPVHKYLLSTCVCSGQWDTAVNT